MKKILVAVMAALTLLGVSGTATGTAKDIAKEYFGAYLKVDEVCSTDNEIIFGSGDTAIVLRLLDSEKQNAARIFSALLKNAWQEGYFPLGKDAKLYDEEGHSCYCKIVTFAVHDGGIFLLISDGEIYKRTTKEIKMPPARRGENMEIEEIFNFAMAYVVEEKKEEK